MFGITGVNHPKFGITLSAETKSKIIEGLFGKKNASNGVGKKKIPEGAGSPSVKIEVLDL